MKPYEFSNVWFDSSARAIWDQLIPKINPWKILEIGTFEGAAACYLIEKLAPMHPIEVHCIDTWTGGIEHQQGGFVQSPMNEVEARFKKNVQLAMEGVGQPVDLVVHKGCSDRELSKLLVSGKENYFDFIYIDGSHQAPDVLFDALLGFRLLKVGGFMAFDDYLWAENLPGGVDPIRCPKPAIDAFTNIYCRKISILNTPTYQLYAQKISD